MPTTGLTAGAVEGVFLHRLKFPALWPYAHQTFLAEVAPVDEVGAFREFCVQFRQVDSELSLVELEGFEPSTSSMPLKRSPN